MIDGKQARWSYDKKSRKAAIHMVSVWEKDQEQDRDIFIKFNVIQ